jgi:hypothetical protein
MDAHRFDRLARTLRAGGSRRAALQFLTGGALAGAMALLGGDEAAARCRPRSRKCGPGVCCPKGQICGDLTSQTCVIGRGTCGADANSCKGSLVHCDNNVDCLCLKTQSGNTRCAIPASACGTCDSDDDCDGVGAFCASNLAPDCCLSKDQRFCAVPCTS